MVEIEIKHLKYRYPGAPASKLALNDISCTIEKGEFIGIIGANGAGKSTFSQALLGLVPNLYHGAYGGSVTIAGKNVKQTPIAELCRTVGLVFQNPFNQITGSKLTVLEEIAFGLENFGVDTAEMHRRIDEVMELLDITSLKNKSPYDLSGGQMQRVALAGIMVMQPDVIVLDEPTSQLDPQGSEEVFRAVESLKNEGKTIIMIEHKTEKIAEFSDRVLLLHEGRLMDFDAPEKIFSRDDLDEYGVVPPSYTAICRRLGVRRPDGLLPVTLAQASAALGTLRASSIPTPTRATTPTPTPSPTPTPTSTSTPTSEGA